MIDEVEQIAEMFVLDAAEAPGYCGHP